jgi:hypothetical protein
LEYIIIIPQQVNTIPILAQIVEPNTLVHPLISWFSLNEPKAQNNIMKKRIDVPIEKSIARFTPLPKFFLGFSIFLPAVIIVSKPTNA